MKAILRFHEKYRFNDRYLIEVSLYEVSDSKRYPYGVKYGLICVDTKNGRRVLMDNHHPKGDHVHLDENELPYDFQSVEKLNDDFKKFVLEHLGVKL